MSQQKDEQSATQPRFEIHFHNAGDGVPTKKLTAALQEAMNHLDDDFNGTYKVVCGDVVVINQRSLTGITFKEPTRGEQPGVPFYYKETCRSDRRQYSLHPPEDICPADLYDELESIRKAPSATVVQLYRANKVNTDTRSESTILAAKQSFLMDLVGAIDSGGNGWLLSPDITSIIQRHSNLRHSGSVTRKLVENGVLATHGKYGGYFKYKLGPNADQYRVVPNNAPEATVTDLVPQAVTSNAPESELMENLKGLPELIKTRDEVLVQADNPLFRTRAPALRDEAAEKTAEIERITIAAKAAINAINEPFLAAGTTLEDSIAACRGGIPALEAEIAGLEAELEPHDEAGETK